MFKVRTVSLGRVLTCSTAALYLGYLWYKRKRTLSHRQSDKKRQSFESSELIKIEIDDQELLQALEKASRTLEVSEIVEEESTESSVDCKEIMEPTIGQVEIKEAEAFEVNNLEEQNLDAAMSTDQKIECIQSRIMDTIEVLTENLNSLTLSPEVEKEVKKDAQENLLNNSPQQVEQTIEKKEECLVEKTCWTEMVENDHCECPKVVNNVKKVKKDEEPMLFEGIKFKGKKKRIRKKNQARDTIQLPSESHIKNKANNKSPKKIISVVEEDCDSAHSVDHSIDTNDAPNTIYSDIRSEVSFTFYHFCLYF